MNTARPKRRPVPAQSEMDWKVEAQEFATGTGSHVTFHREFADTAGVVSIAMRNPDFKVVRLYERTDNGWTLVHSHNKPT